MSLSLSRSSGGGPAYIKTTPGKQGAMRGLARWCMAHRRRVIVGWLAVAVLATVLSHAIGPNYSTVFSLPGTESQRARELLKQEFQAQSGDADTIVFHVAHGSVDSPESGRRSSRSSRASASSRTLPASSAPTASAGAVQVSANRMTAFATVNYDKQANLLSNDTGKPLLADVKAVRRDRPPGRRRRPGRRAGRGVQRRVRPRGWGSSRRC